MNTKLFTALFYLFVCGALCVSALADNNEAPSPAGRSVGLFQKNQITKAMGPNGKKEEEKEVKVENYYLPFLMATDDVMVAVAAAKRSRKYGENIDLLTQYIDINKLLEDQNVASTGSDWQTQFAVENVAKEKGDYNVVKGLMGVAAKNKIYLLFINYTQTNDPSTISDFKFKVAVGTVNNNQQPKKTIVWDERTFPVDDVNKELQKKLVEGDLGFYPFSGSAFLTNDGKVVFAVVVNSPNEKMTALIHSNSDKTELGFVFPKVAEHCYPYFFPWQKKIIMVPVNCNIQSERKIMESSDMGLRWSKSNGAFAQHYDFLQDKKNFTTVTIQDRHVLLFTEERAKSDNGRELCLWMFDGSRFITMGSFAIDNSVVFLESVLPTSRGLFFLHKTGENKYVLRHFHMTKKNITSILTVWDKNDKKIKQLCRTAATTRTPCSTDGLVGFLSGTAENNNNHWVDEYHYANAIVANKGKATKVQNGFTFSGKGAGAQWPVGERKGDQPYNFVNFGFTLVATVNVANNDTIFDNSLFGVVLNENIKPVGLWCSKGKKWAVSDGKTTVLKESEEECEQEKTYSVALVLEANKMLEIYVDGKALTDLNSNIIKNGTPQYITHFFFGADSKTEPEAETDVTITNVLLYNRPFTATEVEELKPKQNTDRETQTHTKNEEEENKETSQSPTTEDSAVRVTVDVLCFMLFGVFTLLGRYVC